MKKLQETKIDGSKAVPFTFTWKPPHAVSTFTVKTADGEELLYKTYIELEEGICYFHFSVTPRGRDETWRQIEIGFRSAIQVFHTVWAIMLQFLDETEDKVDVIAFTADSSDESRNRFYHTISQQIADIFDVEYSFQEDPVNSIGGENSFEIPINWVPR